MPETLTPSQRLAEVLLGRPLVEYVNEKRQARPRWPWKLIAEQIALDTDGQVAPSSEAVRQWYGDSERIAS